MKELISKSFKFIPAALGLVFCLLANPAGAQTVYWDNNGLTTPTGGTWDTATPAWSTDPAGVDSGSLIAFPAGGLPVFCAGATTVGPIEVDVNTVDLSVNGVYNNGIGGTACALTLGGSGSLSLPAGFNTFYVSSAASNTTVNIPINGTGGLQTGGSGTLFLYSPTGSGYSGGTLLASSALTYFNNNTAFGTGAITPSLNGNPGYCAILGSGGSLITLANPWTVTGTPGSVTNGINFATSANTPVTCSGNWTLQAPLWLRQNGPSTSLLTLSGVISDAGNNFSLNVSANNSGTILLSGANTYGGGTTIAQGSSGVTVQLGNASALGTGATTIASGCALDLNGNSITAALTLNGSGIPANTGALINSSATPASLSASSTLTMGNGGQNYIGGTGDTTINCPITSVGNQNFVKTGTGTLTFNAANSFGTGQCILGGGSSAGTLAIGNASALGGGTFNVNIAPATVRSADATPYSFNNALTLGASGTLPGPHIIFGAPGTGNLTFSGAANTGGTADKTIQANGITVEFSGVISGNGATKTLGWAGANGGIIVLSGASTYQKINNLYSGTVRVAHSEVSGTSGPLGAKNTANFLVFGGGTLQYSSANQFDYSGRFSTAASQQYNIDVNGQGVTFATALTSSGGTLKLSDTAGGGTLTLTKVNTYAGGTTINAGTLALSGSGAIGSSSSITVGAGATFDVSALTTALTLGAGQTLQAGGTGGSSATIATASGKGLTLGATSPLQFTAYDGTTVPLTISGADSLAIGTGNAVTVTTTTQLGVGSYKLIQIGSGNTAAVTGTPASSVTVNGSGIASGTFASLRVTGGELYLDVQNLVAVTGMSIAPAGGGNLAISYSGGAGSQFVLLQTNNVAAPMINWTRLQTNPPSSSSFTITPGSDPVEFYRIKSE